MNRLSSKQKKKHLDTLYRKVKSIWKKYVDADDFHISICAADTIFTYYQDRLGLVHYLFFVGGATSGKSNRLEVFRFLAYRNWTFPDYKMTPKRHLTDYKRAVLTTMTMRLTRKEAVAYLQAEGYPKSSDDRPKIPPVRDRDVMNE